MAIELKLLVAAASLGLVQLAWGAAAANRQTGTAWNVGPRDEPKPLTGMAGRLQRAFANYRETFPIFAACTVGVYLAAKTGPMSANGAWAYLAGRIVYVPLYAFGVPYVRTLAWVVSLIGIIMVIVAFFQ